MKQHGKIQIGNMSLDAEIDITEIEISEEEKQNINKAFADMKAYMEKYSKVPIVVEGTMTEPPIPIQQATLEFLCGECYQTSSFQRVITLGNNITDIICSHCGEHWHVNFQVLSLDPLLVGDWLSKRLVGIVKDGMFFEKSRMQ